LIPGEWARTHGDFSRFGLTGPEVTPYVSTFDGDAIPGQAPPSTGPDNQWLISSVLNSFVLAHRAGLKADFPREYDDWAKRPMLFLPSPLTSTASVIAHVHSDFYEKARKYVEGGGFLYASVAADAAIPTWRHLRRAAGRYLSRIGSYSEDRRAVWRFEARRHLPLFRSRREPASLGFIAGSEGRESNRRRSGRTALRWSRTPSARGRRCSRLSHRNLSGGILRRHLRKRRAPIASTRLFVIGTGVKAAFQSDQPSVESNFVARRPSRVCRGGESQCAVFSAADLDIAAGKIGPPD